MNSKKHTPTCLLPSAEPVAAGAHIYNVGYASSSRCSALLVRMLPMCTPVNVESRWQSCLSDCPFLYLFAETHPRPQHIVLGWGWPFPLQSLVLTDSTSSINHSEWSSDGHMPCVPKRNVTEILASFNPLTLSPWVSCRILHKLHCLYLTFSFELN